MFRHAGEDSAGFSKLDKASGKRVDLVYFVIRGLDKVNWGNKNADTCLLSVKDYNKIFFNEIILRDTQHTSETTRSATSVAA